MGRSRPVGFTDPWALTYDILSIFLKFMIVLLHFIGKVCEYICIVEGNIQRKKNVGFSIKLILISYLR